MTPYPQTTAYEREILKHYYMHAGEGASREPWKGGSEHWLQLDIEVIRKFVDAGLLIQLPGDLRTTRIAANREALAVYFHALDCVPLPVRTWTIPEFQA
jgi:hypothetical protein